MIKKKKPQHQLQSSNIALAGDGLKSDYSAVPGLEGNQAGNMVRGYLGSLMQPHWKRSFKELWYMKKKLGQTADKPNRLIENFRGLFVRL
ncbi:hypothetical protein NDU88_003639 [Pleurodeles waltl]|uniref:Uncharacterized protein n=1 Tax=Pleurodeles waltl TaxID=8319 RepID=A0AAV7PBS4_PLEWA|nr:hypothetical protein NDU88_003639 [Pleurodeles waltl]